MDLEAKTMLFWSLSRVFRGQDHTKKPPTTQQALYICTATESELNPARPLSRRVIQLKIGIIEGRSRKKLPPKNNVQQIRAS